MNCSLFSIIKHWGTVVLITVLVCGSVVAVVVSISDGFQCSSSMVGYEIGITSSQQTFVITKVDMSSDVTT